jgi:ParB family chromosome partitioning protein
MIPINLIHILNPRTRSKLIFQRIISNISHIGLKKPITVSRRLQPLDGKLYNLVCGQGRIETYLALGQTEIPALIQEVSVAECYLMSLAENLARRRHSPLELLREIGHLKERGYALIEIARKTDLNKSYVSGILHLLERGEDRLIHAVEKGHVPLSVAIEIANSNEEGVQRALCEAYEDNVLRGEKLTLVRRIIEQRQSKGKKLFASSRRRPDEKPSAEALLRVYRQETTRQKMLVKQAQLTQGRLLFITSALKKLFEDEYFVTLLRAELLDTLPAYLAERVRWTAKG